MSFISFFLIKQPTFEHWRSGIEAFVRLPGCEMLLEFGI